MTMRSISEPRALLVLGCMLLLFRGGTLPAAEAKADARSFWPAWRGPEGTGVGPLADPPLEWSEERNIRWRFPIPGSGASTPIVWGDLVFIQSAIAVPGENPEAARRAEPGERPERPERGRRGPGGGRGGGAAARHQFLLLAIDRRSGELRWSAVAREEAPHEGHHQDHGYASASPVTDGEHIFAYFGSRGLHAFDLEGRRQWEVDFGDMRTRNGFGEGSSPALHGDTLVVNWDHEGESFITAVDKRSGKPRWRRERDEQTSWATPIVVEGGGRTQVVVGATNRTRSYDLESGELLWECGGQTSNVIPTAVTGFGRVYVTSGFRGSALQAIELDRRGDLTRTDAIAWSLGRATPYVPSPLLDGHRLYFFSGNRAILSCHDAKSGEAIFETQRIEALDGIYASPVAAAGRIYIAGRNGKAVVLKSGPAPEVLATNELDDRIDASPALVGGELYLRGHRHLYCIAAEAKGQTGGTEKGAAAEGERRF
jgi:outer membrane protein assembly factor BamB